MFRNLFVSIPGQEFAYYTSMIILATTLVVGGIIFSIIYNKKKKHDFAFKRLFKKVSRNMVLMGILFGFLSIVRYEAIPFFSMRIWIYLSLLGLIFLAYRYIKLWKADYPREKENVTIRQATKAKNKETENKYLPHKRKK